MDDVFKSAGAPKSVTPGAGGGVVRNVPVLGTVKNNIDPTRAGRIQVYLADLGGNDPDDSNNWVTVSYMSPFYGHVKSTAAKDTNGDFVGNPVSYGVWNSPPDINSTVVCIFVNGDPNFGFYIGCVPEPETLHMVPAIGSAPLDQVEFTKSEDQSYGGSEQLPVTNINTSNESIADDASFLTGKKPIHSYVASIMFKQGILRDKIRGPITSGAQRETPSRIGWGVSSPGRPIYAGGYDESTILDAAIKGQDKKGLDLISRRGGHSIVLDDGDILGQDQLVRIRSAAGHQILMSDDGQTLFIIHSNGQSWVELGKEGTIDMFSTNSFNVRTQGDINLHADNNINIHAKKKLNIKAEDIYMQSELTTSHKVGSDYKIETGGKYNLKVGDVMSLASGGVASFLSSSTTFINGSRINLNTGEGPNPDTVEPIADVVHTDTMFDSVKGFLAAPAGLYSITSRAPAHAPWVNANQGVNIKTDTTADGKLPSAPSSEVQKANDVSATTPPAAQMTSAALSTVPAVPPISASLDAATSGGIVGAIATNAAIGPAAAAVTAGIAAVPTPTGLTAAVGTFAQTPAQLEAGGFLKPGASFVVNSLVEKGSPLTSAFPENLFTGQGGITSIGGLIGSAPAQVLSVTNNLQKAQTSLTNAGVLSGAESGTSIAGTVMAGVTAGINNTVGAIKSIGTNIASGVGGAVASVSSLGAASALGSQNPVTTAMNAGNFAAGAAASSIGGLGPITNMILPTAGLIAGVKLQQKGAAAAAFATVAASLGTLSKPSSIGGVSGLLSKTGQILGANTKIGGIAGALSGGLNSITQLASGGAGSLLSGGIGGIAGQLSSVSGVVSSIGKIGALTGSSSLAKTAGTLNKTLGKAGAVTNQLSNLNKGISAIASATSAGQALGGLNTIFGAVGRTGSILGKANIAKASGALSRITANSGNILSAVNQLGSSKNVNQTLGAVSSILSSTNNIANAFGNNSKSTGLFKIPGGQLSVGSLVNAGLGSIGIPKNYALGSVISGGLTSAINQVAFPKLPGGGTTPSSGLVSGITSTVNNAAGGFTAAASGIAASAQSTLSAGLNGVANNVTSGLSGLAKGISSGLGGLAGNLSSSLGGLNDAASGALNSAISSIGFGGAGALKAPTAAIDTNNTAAINQTADAVIEDPRVPKPKFGEVSESTNDKLIEELNKSKKATELLETLLDLTILSNDAKQAYYDAELNLPPGSPEIDEIRQIWYDARSKVEEVADSIKQLIGDAPEEPETPV